MVFESITCPSCGAVVFASNRLCGKCGKALSATSPKRLRPEENHLWRDNDLLVLDFKAQMPDRCVICNRPANGLVYPSKLYYSPNIVWWQLLIGYLTLQYKTVNLPLGFCADEHSSLLIKNIIGTVIILSGLGIFFTALIFDKPDANTYWLLLRIAVGLIISSIGCLVVGHTPIKIEYAKNSRFWVKGVNPKYLEKLAQLKEPI